jgi:hypothetical protein
MTGTPAHWPKNIIYTNALHYHSSVEPGTRSYIQGDSKSTKNPETHRYLVVIRPISLPSHPAAGQFGLFAARKISPRTRILDYTGEVHCDERPDSDYDLSLLRTQDGVNVGVDASAIGNEARFINDFRGIRDKPNAIFVESRASSGELRMSVWSVATAIKKGDEIVVSYGKSWWRTRNLWS